MFISKASSSLKMKSSLRIPPMLFHPMTSHLHFPWLPSNFSDLKKAPNCIPGQGMIVFLVSGQRALESSLMIINVITSSQSYGRPHVTAQHRSLVCSIVASWFFLTLGLSLKQSLTQYYV